MEGLMEEGGREEVHVEGDARGGEEKEGGRVRRVDGDRGTNMEGRERREEKGEGGRVERGLE